MALNETAKALRSIKIDARRVFVIRQELAKPSLSAESRDWLAPRLERAEARVAKAAKVLEAAGIDVAAVIAEVEAGI